MKIESHLANLEESLSEIDRAIQEGIAKKQRTLGFHISAASVDMLEILLHRLNLLTFDQMVKHDWLASLHKTGEKLYFDFPEKARILGLMRKIEEKRNILCYGKRQDESTIEELISTFNELRAIFISLGLKEIR